VKLRPKLVRALLFPVKAVLNGAMPASIGFGRVLIMPMYFEVNIKFSS